MQRSVSARPEKKLAVALAKDADVQALMSATPAQIDAWVEANVTTLAAVRRVLKLLLKLLVIAMRRQG